MEMAVCLTFSDPPYPFSCLLKGFATTLERYQTIIEVDQQNSFFDSNYNARQRDGSLSKFSLPAPLNA